MKRRRRRSGYNPVSGGSGMNDNSELFLKKTVATYLDRHLASYPKLTRALFASIHWVLGENLLEEWLDYFVLMKDRSESIRFERDLRESIDDGWDFGNELEGLVRGRSDLKKEMARFLRELLVLNILNLVEPGKCPIQKNLAQFKQMFGLTDLETDVCLYLFVSEVWRAVDDFLNDDLCCNEFKGRKNLAIILGSSLSQISEALNGTLLTAGIIDSDHHDCISMESTFVRILHTASDTHLQTEFFKKINPDPISLDAHVIDPDVTYRILALLSAKPEQPVHILLYGPPGTGKTSFAHGLGRRLGLPMYQVEHGGKEEVWKRQAAVTACVNMAARGEDALIIADDADNILETIRSFFSSTKSVDRTWLHTILETPGVRMIWTVNSIFGIEDSVARRLTLSVHFKPFTRKQRLLLWESTLNDNGLRESLGDAEIKKLAAHYEAASPAVIEQSVRKASECALHPSEDVYACITMFLDAHECLVHGGVKPHAMRTVGSSFILDALNTSVDDMGSLLDELEAYDSYVKKSDNEDAPTMGLLFHGPPGTGKSHFATYIAERLDREVVRKRASDLLGPLVGMTERLIREAFEEAEAREAILIIDEAESLLFSRDRAHRTWEMSQTNEFLTWMEQFKGIQIFTTNRLTDLDNATLRRFNHKIEFRYLSSDGNMTFYEKVLAPLARDRMSTTIVAQVKSLSKLTPGDFKVIKNLFTFKDPKSVTNQALVAALEQEAKLKSIHAGEKAIGF